MSDARRSCPVCDQPITQHELANRSELCEGCVFDRIRQAVADKPEYLQRGIDLVRSAARRLLQADGVSFVVRDGDDVVYAEEDAIASLWKGKRFPAADCLSGWVTTHGESAVVPDVYADERVLHDAYRQTFVKSALMVPVGRPRAIGAVGAYWSTPHAVSPTEVDTLLALADSAFLAIADDALPPMPADKERADDLRHAK